MPVETAPIKQPSIWAQIIVLLVQYWIYFLMVFLALIVIVTVFLILKKMKKHIDPFADEYKKVKNLCKFQKDSTIREVYMMSELGLKHIGHYIGEAITQDGYKNILFWKFKKWYLFWFPARLDFFDVVKETMIIRSNMNKEYSYKELNTDTKEEQEKTIKLQSDLMIKSEDKLIIKGFGLERVRYFMYPVLRDKEGNLIDKSTEIFERERNPALISAMYQQAEDFANVSRELINLNPSARFQVKTGTLPEKKSE
jgi:hypothetical protein